MRREQRASCTNSDYEKMANLAIKADFGKNGEYAKNSSRVWPNIQIR